MITTLTNLETGLTVHKVSGVVSADTFLKSLHLLKDPVTPNVVWDLREVYNLHDIDATELQSFSIHILDMPIEVNGKAAIVFASRPDYDLGQQFEAFAKMHKPPFEIDLFESMESALSWLAEE